MIQLRSTRSMTILSTRIFCRCGRVIVIDKAEKTRRPVFVRLIRARMGVHVSILTTSLLLVCISQ